MSDVLPYLFIYYTFIDSQRECIVSAEKMVPFWVKSRHLFYSRLLSVSLNNQWMLPVAGIALVTIGIVLQVLQPFMLYLVCLMYVSNCLLQHHRVYGYIKYVLYLLPLLPLVFEQILLVYVVLGVIVLVNIYLLVSFQFTLYASPPFQLRFFAVRPSIVGFISICAILFTILLVILHYYNINVPVEEICTGILLIMVSVMEVDISKNKMLALRVRSRFDLVRSKSKTLNLAFLVPKQKYEIFAILGLSLLTVIVFGMMRGNYVASALIFIGICMYFLYVIDYIVWHVLLEQSIVYANKVVNEGIRMLLSSVVFIYLIAFTASKYLLHIDSLQRNATMEEVLALFGGTQIVYGLFYAVLLSFFIYRLHQTFSVNNRSASKEIELEEIKE